MASKQRKASEHIGVRKKWVRDGHKIVKPVGENKTETEVFDSINAAKRHMRLGK